jgi:exoenzyme U
MIKSSSDYGSAQRQYVSQNGSRAVSQSAVSTVSNSSQFSSEHLAVDNQKNVLAKNIGRRNMTLKQLPYGRVELTIDRARPRVAIYAGGGNKGNALVGGIKALQESGVLKDLEELYGSSAGAMTATLVACGVTAEELKEHLDNLNFKELFGGIVEHGLSAKGIAKGLRPGKDLQAPGEKFENAMRDLTRQAVLKRITHLREVRHQANTGLNDVQLLRHLREKLLDDDFDLAEVEARIPERALQDISPEDQARMDEVFNRLSNGADVTFEDLSLLSQFIPEIKQLTVTGVALDTCKNAELVVFNSNTEPHTAVARAAHISGAFPIAFRPVRHEFSYGGIHDCIDGGVMNNVPSPGTINRVSEDPIPKGEEIISIFEGDDYDRIKNDNIVVKGSRATRARDFFVAKGSSAMESFTNQTLVGNDQIIPVRLKNKFGDFSDMKNGTLNFDMPAEARAAMQHDAYEDMHAHLKWRKENPFRLTFDSVPQFLYALDDDQFGEMVENADQSEFKNEILEAKAFRENASAQVAQLAETVKTLDEKTCSLLPSPFYPEIVACFTGLEKSVGTNSEQIAAKTEYLARLINQPQSGPVSRLMEASKQAYKNAVRMETFPVIHAAITTGIRNDVQAAAENILRDQIYPARMRHANPTKANLELLDAVEARLKTATDYRHIKLAMQLLHNGYDKAKLGLGASKTVRNAKTIQNLGWHDVNDGPARVADHAIKTLVIPALKKNQGSSPVKQHNTKVLQAAWADLENATTASEVNVALGLIIKQYEHRKTKLPKSVEIAQSLEKKLISFDNNQKGNPKEIATMAINNIIMPALKKNAGIGEIEQENRAVLDKALLYLRRAEAIGSKEERIENATLGLNIIIGNYQHRQADDAKTVRDAEKLMMPV